MNVFEKLFLSKQTRQLLQKKALQTGVRYEIRNGLIVTPSDKKTDFIDKGYTINDIVYSIVNIILDKVRLPYWGIYKVVDESSLKRYDRLIRKQDITGKEFKQALKLKEQALEPITSMSMGIGKLNELLKYPNSEETFQDFVTNGAGFKLITGDCYMWAELLKAGANQGIPETIELLPSQHMVIKAGNMFPLKAESYELNLWSIQQFTKEEILHEKYWNPSWGMAGQHLYGMSPLKAALKNITRNNSAKTASTNKYDNNGMDVIIYPDDNRWTVDEGVQQAAAIKEKLIKEYSGVDNYGKIAASGIKMGAVNLGLSPVELGIIESEKWDALMFCAVYGVPPELIGLVNKTYNNVREAEKALTTRSAIPLLTSRRNSFNRKIQTDWGFKGQNVYIDYDLDCFTELETNIKETIEWTSKIIAISPNEERELAGLESDPDPIMDEMWVQSGGSRVPLSEFNMNIVDQTLANDGTAASNGTVSANGQGKRGVSY